MTLETFYLLDDLGNILTGDLGNRLTFDPGIPIIVVPVIHGHAKAHVKMVAY